MWEVFLIILEQLGNTFKWGLIGFVLGIVILYLLRKSSILQNQTFFQVLRNSIYYIFIPIALSSTFWLYASTKHLEKDIHYLANESINKTEEFIYPAFNKYITQNISNYVNLNHIPTNDEIVSNFLNETKKSSWLKKRVLHWALVETLKTAEIETLERLGIDPKNKELNILILANKNNQLEKVAYDLPFKKMRGLTYNEIEYAIKKYYKLYYIFFGIIFVMLIMNITFSLSRKNI